MWHCRHPALPLSGMNQTVEGLNGLGKEFLTVQPAFLFQPKPSSQVAPPPQVPVEPAHKGCGSREGGGSDWLPDRTRLVPKTGKKSSWAGKFSTKNLRCNQTKISKTSCFADFNSRTQKTSLGSQPALFSQQLAGPPRCLRLGWHHKTTGLSIALSPPPGGALPPRHRRPAGPQR